MRKKGTQRDTEQGNREVAQGFIEKTLKTLRVSPRVLCVTLCNLFLLLLLAACQPNVAYVEVTREVFVDVPTPQPAEAVTPIYVTRVVIEEAMQIVPEEVVIEVTKAPVGTESRPVQLLFAPVVNTSVITARAQPLADALTAATGRAFEIGILDSEQTVIDLMCAAPQDTIAILSAADLAQAEAQCGVQPGLVAVRPDGLTWQVGMITARRDSGIETLEDLAGKSWGVVDTSSVPEFTSIQTMLADAGVEPGEIIEFDTTSSLMLALYNGEVDFVTAAYTPPIMPYEERLWVYGEDDPEIWRRLGVPPSRSPIGYVIVWGEVEFGGYRLRDARASIFDTQPEIYNQTKIIALSPQIPNDTVTFGAEFPLGLAREVTAVLSQFAASEACVNSLCSTDFYGWAGLEAIGD